MIKARPVAADIASGKEFLRTIRPFVWRRSLDFEAIRDIHAIKRQIDARHRDRRIEIAGHNIKLGRGGIREIEFFVQTQQLIWGGRYQSLRCRATVNGLRALARLGRISERDRAGLTEAYWFLRRVENRLQMIEDRQVHVVPESEQGLAGLATFLGYGQVGDFEDALRERLERVGACYSQLFEDAPELGAPLAEGGNLVFTGVDDDPETLRTLRRLGFRRPETVSEIVRGWHRGRQRAMRSERARRILTRLMPALLAALGRTADPDAAFLNFHQFLSNLSAGV